MQNRKQHPYVVKPYGYIYWTIIIVNNSFVGDKPWFSLLLINTILYIHRYNVKYIYTAQGDQGWQYYS